MKLLVVGNGAREHIIAEVLKSSPSRPRIFAYMSTRNPGIHALAEDWTEGAMNDVETIKRYAQHIHPDLVVFGSEAPLAVGAVDKLEGMGIPCVGPANSLARIEADKAFMRDFMGRYIRRGFPQWKVFDSLKSVEDYLQRNPSVVLKPIGLTGGKGVRVMGRQLVGIDDAIEYAQEVIAEHGRILVEEKLDGEEFSLMVFTDGKEIIPMPLVQDYKYAKEGNTGAMTGGMGSYSQADHRLPFVSERDFDNALSIVSNTIWQLSQAEGKPYKGILYGQFIQTEDGPKIVEFNVRFGDPEAMNVLSIMGSDLVEVFRSIAEGNLIDRVEFERKATVCKYLVPNGYPETPEAERPFHFPWQELSEEGIRVYFASVREENGSFFTTRSRSLALLQTAPTAQEAKDFINEVLNRYCPPELVYRQDIPLCGPEVPAQKS